MAHEDAVKVLTLAGLPAQERGMLLHLSGSQWYKNLPGVIQLYAEYAKLETQPLQLWCICPPPNAKIQQLLKDVPAHGQVLFFRGLNNQALVAAYALARVFLLPSLAEGFGWPIIEAQACGCPVLTTDAPPMNEIGGPAASYLPLLHSTDDVTAWAVGGASAVKALLAMTPTQRQQRVALGLSHAAQFTADKAITGYLQIYEQVLARAGATGNLT
jgi:glycosyltransferase involved in cell wall biosynthesis